jgi:alpha-L-fucosidase
VDIVSKNGNLCLNIPLKGDGFIDSDERQILMDLASWMPIHGEAICGARPFSVYGEGPPDIVATGNFNEGKGRPYIAADMRFTVKDGNLYVIALGWPDNGELTINTLAQGSRLFPMEVVKVKMLGSDQLLKFERRTNAWMVSVPSLKPNDIAYAFRITPNRPLQINNRESIFRVPKQKQML